MPLLLVPGGCWVILGCSVSNNQELNLLAPEHNSVLSKHEVSLKTDSVLCSLILWYIHVNNITHACHVTYHSNLIVLQFSEIFSDEYKR